MYNAVPVADTWLLREDAPIRLHYRGSQLTANCFVLTSKTFLSTNEAAGSRAESGHVRLVVFSAEVCFFFERQESRVELIESGLRLIYNELFGILWKECEDGLHCWLLQ